MEGLVGDKCQMCLKVFKSKTEFKDHVDRDHKGHECIFPCAECYAFFKERRKLECHVIARHSYNFEPVNCPYKNCKTTLLRKDQMRRHLTEVHRADPNDYVPPLKMSKIQNCDEWNNGSRRVIKLRTEMNFKCLLDWCSHVTKGRSNFISHMDRAHKMKKEAYEKLNSNIQDDTDESGGEIDGDVDDDDCEVVETSSDSENDNGHC